MNSARVSASDGVRIADHHGEGHLKVMIVDDEPLARQRLRTLLTDLQDPGLELIGEAAHAAQAMDLLSRGCNLLLLDIHMPVTDGLTLAQTLNAMPNPPAVVFVTAHTEHAVRAFELEAVDYLTKPVRLERLRQAMQKAQRWHAMQPDNLSDDSAQFLSVHERGRIERVPLAEVLYLKAELKYLTLRTALRSYIHDGSLNELEAQYPSFFLRIHRNALVSRRALRALERQVDPQEGEGWTVRLADVTETLTVSRRQLAAVRALLQAEKD